jgi:hypothetical protein
MKIESCTDADLYGADAVAVLEREDVLFRTT